MEVILNITSANNLKCVKMNNSQSSDCFPEDDDSSYMSPAPMDTVTYETLLENTKEALNNGFRSELQKDTFATYFTTVLEECSTCINQSLDLITELLSNSICINKLTEYLSDAACLLQMLSDSIKTVIESVSMTCSALKMFPTSTGHIIFTVFSHCKGSESLYGDTLNSVEKQLKDLFRNCHELQLTYLMILQKHFIFDVTENEEKLILIETVKINLKIGELVQSLDIKTMAEQWKGIVVFSEKYANVLSNTSIFQESVQIYCKSMRDNVKIALEQCEDVKIHTRALKTASFALQILWKTFQAFREAKSKDYTDVIDLMFYIQRIRHLERPQFTDLLISSEDLLIKELLADGTFCGDLLNYDLKNVTKLDDFLGYVLTLTSLMRRITQGDGTKIIPRSNLINCVYEVLRYGLYIFSTEKPLKLELIQETHGLFEHLLINTAAMAMTCSSEEFCLLERNMVESILSTDCCKALFSANLWTVLARNIPSRLLFNQFIWLCTMFKTLEKNRMFHRSPQKVHLRYTITRLFGVMDLEDQLKIRKQFSILDDDNLSLWAAFCVYNFPEDRRCADENVVVDKLKQELRSFNGNGEAVDRLIKIINLAATCTFPKGTGNGRDIEELVLHAWSKTCPKHFAIESLDSSTLWYYDYLQALVALTECTWHRLCEKNSYLVRLLHFVSGLVQQCNTEFNLILINTLCKLGSSDNIPELKFVDENFAAAFSLLFRNSEIERSKLNAVLSEYKHDKNLERIIYKINDEKLIETWCNIKCGQYFGELDPTRNVNHNYSHKCIEREVLSQRSSVADLAPSSGNFEFADIDNFFMSDSIEEPSSKKVKLNSDTEAIIGRLENDALLLCNVKENVFTADYKNRIRNVCDKLRNIV